MNDVTAQVSQRSNIQPNRSTAEIVIDSLVGAGIDTLYCLPGVQNDPFFDALWHRQSELKPIHSRHEQGAAYMAMGAALATGKPQVCCLVPGVGFLNGATAFATAYSTGAPVMILLSQIPMAQIGRGFGALHEVVDQSGILRTLTKSSKRVDSASEAPTAMQAILSDLVSGRPRPVGIEVPTDMWANAAPTGGIARGRTAHSGRRLGCDREGRGAAQQGRAAADHRRRRRAGGFEGGA